MQADTNGEVGGFIIRILQGVPAAPMLMPHAMRSVRKYKFRNVQPGYSSGCKGRTGVDQIQLFIKGYQVNQGIKSCLRYAHLVYVSVLCCLLIARTA